MKEPSAYTTNEETILIKGEQSLELRLNPQNSNIAG